MKLYIVHSNIIIKENGNLITMVSWVAKKLNSIRGLKIWKGRQIISQKNQILK
jgi:hypothetical protein